MSIFAPASRFLAHFIASPGNVWSSRDRTGDITLVAVSSQTSQSRVVILSSTKCSVVCCESQRKSNSLRIVVVFLGCIAHLIGEAYDVACSP